MSNPKQNKPGGKTGQRARKPDPSRIQQPDQAPSPTPAQEPEVIRPIEAAVATPAAVTEPAAIAAPAALAEPTAVAVPAALAAPATPAGATPASLIGAAELANMASIDIQTIALAYGEYTRKSFEQTKQFVEKLSGVRSLDKAFEIQTEFAKQAYETFVTDSQKIRQLYSCLAKQTFEGAVAKVIPTAR